VSGDEATLSDKMFLFDYMIISLMIGISILRVNRAIDRVPWLDKGLGVLHIVGVPVIVLLMALYVLGSSQSDGQMASSFWTGVGKALW
jgi:hypothetical protein